MALTSIQEQIRDLLVRQRELRINRAKLTAQRDETVDAAYRIFAAAKAQAERDFAAAVATIDTELEQIGDKLAGKVDIQEA